MSVPIKQSVPISFSGGLDLKTDPWQVGPASFLALNNSVFTAQLGGGGARLNKRNGFAGLGTTVNPTAPVTIRYSNIPANLNSARKIFSYNNELCVNDAFNLYSYDKSNNGWTYKGRSTIVGLSTSDIAQDVQTKINMDVSIDTTSGIKVFAWSNNVGFDEIRYSIQDATTGEFIVNKALFGAVQVGGSGFQNPRCVSISGKSWIVAYNNADGALYAQLIVGQVVTGGLFTIVTDVNVTHPNYDIDVSAGNIYLAYYSTAPSIKIDLLTNSLAVSTSISKAESGSNGVSFFGDGTNIWVVYNNNAATKAFIVNNAVTSTTLAPTVVDSSAKASNVVNVTGAWSSTLSVAFIFYDTTSAVINVNTLTVSGTPGTALEFMRSVNIVSKAFPISGIPHVAALFTSNLQSTYFLLNLYNLTPAMGTTPYGTVVANIAAKIAPDAAGSLNISGYLCGAHNTTGSIWEMALGQKTVISLATSSTTQYSPVGVIDCLFDFSLSNPDVQVLGLEANIASGELIAYDGGSVVEQNFHIYPEGSTGVNAAGGNLTAGPYGYKITYEWFDNQGQVHRSSQSPVLNITAIANSKNTLTIPTLRVTNKSGGQVNINVYRTQASQSVYFLVASTFGTVLNDSTVDTVTYVDAASDASIQNNLQLYTTGEVDDFAPPAARALATFKNRILLVTAEGGFDFFYSKQVQVGFPVEFSPFFDLNIGTVAGPLTAIAGMDDKIILFKSGLSSGPSILYMVGTGPAPSGSGNDFNDPLPVAVDCGCVDRSSIVLTPSGLIFKSAKGIYQLDRNLQASYIGARVEAYNQYSVVSSQLIPNTTQVRFLLSNGTLLMYDYFYGEWSTFSNPAGISDCIFQGQHTYVASNGQVYQETPGVYVDGTNTPVLLSFTIAWIKLAGLQGYQRSFFMYLLANYLSPHQLSINTYTDFSSVADQNDVITPNTTDFLENWRLFFKKQRCQSFQIALQEIYTGTPGPGFTMSGLNLIVGAKSKFRTISAADSVG